MTHRGKRKRARLKACLSVPHSCFQNIFGSFDQKELGSQSRSSCQVNPTLKKRDRKPAGWLWVDTLRPSLTWLVFGR
ncbi:hypothetical protein THAOC_04197 [Thalassiosira oceanica]|uniref:Uncharacterized protein n=1 Tax=Thalassiosira oceanica TaxID=159749 RepID=K0T9F2_THAOC|nr:hypothetical protein THAOC_04197 [Thalassiosira oceanica]|eukprot:EJK74145.1 hypothetical protein THAOC_04197 [Thalassiosira oceanica]